MITSEKLGYVKRTQKDYSISFKLQLVEEIEHGYMLTPNQMHKQQKLKRKQYKLNPLIICIDY